MYISIKHLAWSFFNQSIFFSKKVIFWSNNIDKKSEGDKLINEITLLEKKILMKGKELYIPSELTYCPFGCVSRATIILKNLCKKKGGKIIDLQEKIAVLGNTQPKEEMLKFLLFLRFHLATQQYSDSENDLNLIYSNYTIPDSSDLVRNIARSITLSHLIGILYEVKFLPLRSISWCRLIKKLEDSFFLCLRRNTKYHSRFGVAINIFMKLSLIRERRMTEDLLLDKILEKCLQDMVISSIASGQLYNIWVTYVQANNYGYLEIASLAENGIINLIPNFEDENLKYIFDSREYLYSNAIFTWLNIEILPFGSYFISSDFKSFCSNKKMSEHFILIFKKTNWSLEKYLKCLYETDVPKDVVYRKIEKLLFPIVETLIEACKFNDSITLIQKISNLASTNLLYHVMYRDTTNLKLRELALYFLTEKTACDDYNFRNIFLEMTVHCYFKETDIQYEDYMKMKGFYLDLAFLEFQDRKGDIKKFCSDSNPNCSYYSNNAIKRIINFVWSEDFRSFLKLKLDE